MSTKRRILFLCTGNSCRSQMAEAILRHVGGERFEALSAGSRPAGFVHPLAVEALRRIDVPIGEPRSKSWDEFADKAVDVVITVCDAAAGEACPIWPGNPVKAHWSLPDPTYHPATADERIEFAVRIANRLHAKIEGLVTLDWKAARAEIEKRLAFLAEI